MYKQVLLGLLMILLGAQAQALVGNIEAGASKTETCIACHGPDGNSTVSLWPKIAGQHESYLVAQLYEYRKGQEGDRNGPTMYPMVQELTDQDIADLSAYYASQKMTPGETPQNYLERGRQLWRGGDISRGITACQSCHGPKGIGNTLANYPRIAGQNADYTIDQLKQYREGQRTSDMNGIMRMIASRLSDADIEAVSHYASGLN